MKVKGHGSIGSIRSTYIFRRFLTKQSSDSWHSYWHWKVLVSEWNLISSLKWDRFLWLKSVLSRPLESNRLNEIISSERGQVYKYCLLFFFFKLGTILKIRFWNYIPVYDFNLFLIFKQNQISSVLDNIIFFSFLNQSVAFSWGNKEKYLSIFLKTHYAQ